jgi:thioredoxin-like negative regulator of GroEL
LWALDQVFQWVKGTNRNMPRELEPILKGLISDQDKKVRLKTAELLALMRTVNSASSLLAQLKVETDEQVKGQLLDTLGWVCFYALSPNSSFKITPETRQQALGWAESFLLDENSNKAQIGARVLKKLLERDGLRPEEADKKLNLFVERYNRLKNNSDETLRGALLSTMAGLVAQDSAYRVIAEKLFRQFFLEALNSKTDIVLESAVEGLANIDKTSALITLRTRGFQNSSSPTVRNMQIELAKNVGGVEDLNWLVEKIGTNSENQAAWQAMLRIFNDSDTNVLNEWVVRLTGSQSKLTDNQKVDLLKIAEAKALGDNKRDVRRQLAEFLYKTEQYEQAADYFGRLKADAQSPEQQQLYLSRQLESCLRWPNHKFAADLIKECLSERDLEPNDVIIQSIENYLSNHSDKNDIDVLLQTLTDINVSTPRAKWGEQMKSWIDRFRITGEPNKEETRINI